MAKEIPYFKFYPNDWVSGDITLEDYEIQGIFINICAYYWSKECELSLINLKKRFRGFELKIEELISSKIIKLVGENITISFLDEQLSSKELQNAVNKMNGRKGGRPKKEKTIRIYLINCFNENENFLKIGITSDTINGRFSSYTGKNKVMPYEYKVLYDEIIDEKLAIDLENQIKLNFKSYDPHIPFGGSIYECFDFTLKDDIIKLLTERKPNGFFLKTERKPIDKDKDKDKEKDIIYKQFDGLSITFEEIETLKNEGYSAAYIDDTLSQIQNYKGNNKYKSLIATARVWMKKNNSNKSVSISEPNKEDLDFQDDFYKRRQRRQA